MGVVGVRWEEWEGGCGGVAAGINKNTRRSRSRSYMKRGQQLLKSSSAACVKRRQGRVPECEQRTDHMWVRMVSKNVNIKM